ncbi:MAG: serine/threonine protein kinase [Proteobacteria bacterium]|nr:serine/threonine protein kinase [Pseudomonadota bacterium]
MRLLLIEGDAQRCEQVRRQLAQSAPRAQLVQHDPGLRGALSPEFLAQGFDAVLLDGHNAVGSAWASELRARRGFAPVLLLCGTDGAGTPPGALRALAADDADPRGEVLADALHQAQQRQRQARALWHSSSAGRDAQRFGDAFIRGFRCIRRLGGGATTDLYLAESERAGELVALKVARDRQGGQPGFDPFRRFLQEYEIARRIATRAVVRCETLGVSDEHAWLVMEYLPRGDLRRHMRRGIGPHAALQMAQAVAGALAELHAAGILHRDVKPGNIMLREQGGVALIDFGLSKDVALEQDLTDFGQIFGTPHYMSPEQGHGEPIDARSDLYSLGVILFEMLTGAKPYRADNPMAIVWQHRKQPIPQLPPPFAALQPLLQGLLAKQPDGRFASARAAQQALQDALALVPARGALS